MDYFGLRSIRQRSSTFHIDQKNSPFYEGDQEVEGWKLEDYTGGPEYLGDADAVECRSHEYISIGRVGSISIR